MKKCLIVLLFWSTLIITNCRSSSTPIVLTSTATIPTPTNTVAPTLTPPPTATATATAETFELMELSADINRIPSCSPEDVFSGRIAWNERQHIQSFPENAVNKGWDGHSAGGGDFLGLEKGSSSVEKIVSICEISSDFLDRPRGKLIIVGLQVLNVGEDQSFGFIHFVTIKELLPKIVRSLDKSNGTGVSILRAMSSELINKTRDHDKYWFWVSIYELRGRQETFDLANQMAITGKVPVEMEKVLWLITFLNL